MKEVIFRAQTHKHKAFNPHSGERCIKTLCGWSLRRLVALRVRHRRWNGPLRACFFLSLLYRAWESPWRQHLQMLQRKCQRSQGLTFHATQRIKGTQRPIISSYLKMVFKLSKNNIFFSHPVKPVSFLPDQGKSKTCRAIQYLRCFALCIQSVFSVEFTVSECLVRARRRSMWNAALTHGQDRMRSVICT